MCRKALCNDCVWRFFRAALKNSALQPLSCSGMAGAAGSFTHPCTYVSVEHIAVVAFFSCRFLRRIWGRKKKEKRRRKVRVTRIVCYCLLCCKESLPLFSINISRAVFEAYPNSYEFCSRARVENCSKACHLLKQEQNYCAYVEPWSPSFISVSFVCFISF